MKFFLLLLFYSLSASPRCRAIDLIWNSECFFLKKSVRCIVTSKETRYSLIYQVIAEQLSILRDKRLWFQPRF